MAPHDPPPSRQLLVVTLTLSVCILVEIFSSPRLLGVLVFKLLLSLGDKPSERTAIALDATRILCSTGASATRDPALAARG